MADRMGRGFGAGLLALSLALGSAPAFATTSATRTSTFAYDTTSGLLTQEVVEPNTSSLRLEKDTGYDAFGNKTSVSVVGVDIATRTSTVTFDAKGQFAVTVTNALGHQESWVYDARFGTPTSHTGPNGLTSTAQYDGFGRKTLEVHEDGTQLKYQYLFCNGINGGTLANCPTNGVYAVVTTPLASNGTTQIGPTSTTYFDNLDRRLAADTQGFSGATIRVSQSYDSLGRVSQSSRPYFLVGGTAHYATASYDILSRPIQQNFPDGSHSQLAYHGLSVTATNQLNQTKTVVRNSQAEVVTVTDALGHSTTYSYDPFGNLTGVTDPVGNSASFAYDTRGRKTQMTDPDMGTWHYSYDTASELVSQTDGKSQVTTFGYDKLGRLLQRVEPDVTCTWTYDTQTKGVGKLASASNNHGFQRIPSYDSLGRPSGVSITPDSVSGTFTIGASYDSNGRLNQLTYPSGFAVTYTYTSLSYVQKLSSGATTYWQVNTMDQELHPTQQTLGNSVVTNQGYDALTGRLLTIQAGTGNSVENLTYTYDALGNVTSRVDTVDSVNEQFGYDQLNRLTSVTLLNASSTVSSAYNSDPYKNLTWGYNPPGGVRPHAVLSLVGGTINASFTYDTNGNQTAGLNRTLVYTSYNKPSSITLASNTLAFSDDTEHQRVKQVAPEGTTLYLGGLGVMAEKFTSSGGSAQWNEYLTVAGQLVGVRFNHIGGSVQTRYFHRDNLGSVVAITDESHTVVQRIAYDVWGKVRLPSGAPDNGNTLNPLTTRGFTGQERLGDVGLVHMNGRVYDPITAKFTSADPFVQDPTNPQSWNRYAYVQNNPLAFTDPSGYFLGGFFHSIGNFFAHVFRAIGAVFREVPILGTIVEIAAAIACGPYGPICAGLAAAFVTGVSSGKIGLALKAGLIAAAVAYANVEIGGLTTPTPGGEGIEAEPTIFGSTSTAFGGINSIANIGLHAALGCAQNLASDGKGCGPGALAGGLSAASGPVFEDLGIKDEGALIGHAVVGGLASVAGGGKFANGALTGAFDYLFNYLQHKPGFDIVNLSPEQTNKLLDVAQDWAEADVPYVYGGKTLSGADCSGSVCAIFSGAGIGIGNNGYVSSGALPGYAATAGTPLVQVTDGLPEIGDIVLWPGHVAIYEGLINGVPYVYSATHTGGEPFGNFPLSYYKSNGPPTFYRYQQYQPSGQ